MFEHNIKILRMVKNEYTIADTDETAKRKIDPAEGILFNFISFVEHDSFVSESWLRI